VPHSADLELASLERNPFRTSLLNHHLSAKLPVLESYSQLANRFHSRQARGALATSWSDEPTLAAAATGQGRIWFSEHALEVVPSDATFMAFVEHVRATGRMPLLVHRSGDMRDAPSPGAKGRDDAGAASAIAALVPARRVAATVERYTPTELALTVTVPAAGWLLVTDRWANGWQAWVDDGVAPIWGGTFLFRAIQVPAGEHRVAFRYRPFGVPWLVGLSWITTLLVALGSVRQRRRTAGSSRAPIS